MKVIVSAVACDPYGGSEGGIGWRIVEIIARDHQVFVLTDERNRDSWEKASAASKIPDSVTVRFLGEGAPWHKNRMRARLQSWLEYRTFNRHQLQICSAWAEEQDVDLIHQVTYATWRIPSDLWKIPKPFVWGPIGGAAKMPRHLYRILSLGGIMFELAREVSTHLSLANPKFGECVANSSMVIPANAETSAFLKPFRGANDMKQLWSGYLSDDQITTFLMPPQVRKDCNGPLRIFAGGNLEGRKGVALALEALAIAKTQGVIFCYVIAGHGPELAKLRKDCARLRLTEDEVKFHSGFEGLAYRDALQSSEIYLLPSFRETTPVTLLEAMLAGCVPVVANSSAAGEIVKKIDGFAIEPTSRESLVGGLAAAILKLWQDRESIDARGKCIANATLSEFGSDRFRATLREIYEQALVSR